MIISANVLNLLCKQYSHELANSIFYAALQSWAEMRGLDGAAAFMDKQSKGERSHADMVLGYIHSRNEQLAFMPLDVPDLAVLSFVDLFTKAQERELATTEAIGAIREQAEAERDMMTCAWLMQPTGLIIEQIEEENTIQTILDRISARMGNVPLDSADVYQAEMPGEVMHDIDVWISKAFA